MPESPLERHQTQRKLTAEALKLRLELLAGALACLPILESSTHANPWLLNWRTVATDESCHLQDLLKPLPQAAFPPSLLLEEGKDEASNAQSPASASFAMVSVGTHVRLGRLILGDLTHRASHVTHEELEEREVIALLGLRLTPCQWNILHVSLAHPLLSDEELAALLGIQRRSVRCSLYELHRLDCLEPIVTVVGKRWHLCGRGLRLIAVANRMHIRNVATLSDDGVASEMSTVVQRGEAWLLQRMKHTAGIYGFFTRLAQAARQETGQELCWWETGVVCERRYRLGEQWHNLKPDALAEYRLGSQPMRFWLEQDRGTMNVRDLAVKFTSYAYYIASREWARERSILPVIICVAPDIAQERRMQRVALSRLAETSGLVLWTTTEVLLKEHGSIAPIWLPGMPQRSQAAQPGTTLRQSAFAKAGERI